MKIQIGDQVCYRVRFLKSIHEHPTSDMYHARGEVVEFRKLGKHVSFTYAIVHWDGHHFDTLPDLVNVNKLARVGSLAATSEYR